MGRPNSPDMPPKRTKKVRLGICILREYGHTRRYRVPRHATCPPSVRNRIRSDSDLNRDTESPMSGYVIKTRRVKTRKCSYTCRFAGNNGLPYTTSPSVVRHEIWPIRRRYLLRNFRVRDDEVVKVLLREVYEVKFSLFLTVVILF